MTKAFLKKALLFLFSAATIVSYQNCGQGFTSEEMMLNEGVGLASSAPTNHDAHAMHIATTATALNPSKEIEFSIHTDVSVSSTSYRWSHTLDGFKNACREVSNATATRYVVNCPRTGQLVVSLIINDGFEDTTLPHYTVALTEALMPNQVISLNVAFNIPAGTGVMPWNSAETVVETFVGQTLKITNLDSVNHQLHTNGKPCGHGSAIAPGATGTCVIQNAYDYKTDGLIYDHNLGTKSSFHLIAYSGDALYTQNCASCHNALSASSKRGATPSDIKSAISNISAMKGNANLMKLSPRQLEAISFALGVR